MWGWVARTVGMFGEALRLPRPITLDLEPLRTFDTAPRPVDRVISAMKNGAGSVSRDAALQVAAIMRGRNELCSIATLPLKLYRGLDVQDSPLFRQFDPNVPNVVLMSALVEDLVFEQIAWWQVTSRDFDGFPMSVVRHDPSRVSLNPPSGKPAPVGERPDRWVWIDFDDGRGPVRWLASDMIRFDSPNPGLLRAQATAIRIAQRLDSLTEMYASNPALREYFTDADDAEEAMSDPDIDVFLAEYGAMRQTRPYGWVPSNVKRSDVSSPSPRDLTLVELRQQAHLAIANGMGVDPEDLGVSTTSRTYFNSVDKKQDKINRTYAPYMSAITDRLSMGDVTKRGYAARFDLTDYLKSSPAEQAAYWKALQDMGVTDAEEIRGWAGLSGPPPAKKTTPAAAPVPVASSRFDGSPAFIFDATSFATPPPAPTVDMAARTITGLAVPYGAVASKFGLKYEFTPGSLEYSEAGRMPHLKDHSTPVGFHRKITDSAAGPIVELGVLDAPDGSPAKIERDQLLYDAEHGLYSGLSIGVDFSLDPADGDVEITEEGVYRVLRATWRETSTTYLPAFDDARVTKVAASMTGGHPVKCPHCQGQHAPNMACATFAALNPNPPGLPGPTEPPPGPDPTQLAAFAAAWNSLRPEVLPAAGPTPVSPHQGPATVSEPAPYRFDRKGNLRAGSHDFSTDLVSGWKAGDLAARDRAESFVADYFEGVQRANSEFAVTPANVVNLNYPANRPDLYVDQLEYLYPMYDAVYKGTLDTVTPFVIPKFNSSSGLVADHVTGTEPTPGAFTATAQTITPSAVSGKVEITREAFDQGGNPQMSGLIWRQMVRGWYEALEAFVQAQLVANAASITDITITTAAVDGALDQALSAAMVPLQYIRGGDVFDTVFTQIDLYKNMIAAKDSTNRRLYPNLGPMNAGGQADRGYTRIDAHGKIWVPAWATAATGSVAASSWMFARDAVCLWASAPKQIELEWRVAWVDLGLFGYKAFGITDFTKTREISYDPV